MPEKANYKQKANHFLAISPETRSYPKPRNSAEQKKISNVTVSLINCCVFGYPLQEMRVACSSSVCLGRVLSHRKIDTLYPGYFVLDTLYPGYFVLDTLYPGYFVLDTLYPGYFVLDTLYPGYFVFNCSCCVFHTLVDRCSGSYTHQR